MDDDSIDWGTRQKLNKVAQRIHDTCRAYAVEFAEAWGIPLDKPPAPLPDAVGATDAFMLGLTQWIVSRGVRLGLKASVKSFMTYRTGSGPGEDDIVSLAIRFKPDPFIHRDPFGLVRPASTQTPIAQRECEQSSTIPSRVRGRISVDEVLRTQADEFEKCMNGSSDLLISAGYNPTTYREWVMAEADRYATA